MMRSLERNNPSRQAWSSLFILLILLLVLSACAGKPGKNDPRPVESVITHAEDLIGRNAYATAAEEYAIVITKQPAIGAHYLRRAELLERVEQDKIARKVYLEALDEIPEDDPDRVEIMHRLGLIDAHRLQRIDDAEELLMELPSNSIPRIDLAAFLYIQASQYKSAIGLLNQALNRVKDNDQRALLLYHAALCYHRMGESARSSKSLLEAINNAEHLGLIRDIETLFSKINKEGAPPPKKSGARL